MITAVLALATSVLFGLADFYGGFASRKDYAFVVTADSHAMGLTIFAVAVLVWPAVFASSAVVGGALAGLFGGVGVVALYAALARGRMSIVAPITAALSGSLPALYDLATGTRVGLTALLGLALAIVATVIVSAAPSHESDGGPRAMPPSALWLALLSGTGFAGSFLAFSIAGTDTGFWPLLFSRVVSVLMLGSIALVRTRGRALVVADARRPTLFAGVFDASANVTMISAIRIGPLAVAAVLGSLYPLVTVLMARIYLGERLRWLQRFGIALAVLAVVLAAWP